MPRRHRAPDPANYAWIFDLLFSGGTTVTWAAAGELPAGFERAEQFAVLSAVAGRSFMVSLAARPGTCSALTSYKALRTARRRLVRDVLSLAVQAGLAQPVLRNKIDIGVASGASAAQLADVLLTEHLSGLLGGGPVMLAFGGGSGPYRKPVLQAFSTDGTPLGYVKVGWNDWTREAVRREAEALRACAARQIRIGVPDLLDHSRWQGLDLLVTAPLPARVRRLPSGWPLPDVAVLREISQLSAPYAGDLATSPWWRGLRMRIGTGVADPQSRACLTQIADAIEGAYGQVRLEFGSWHGDFVPWNMATHNGRLYLWDWESSAPQAPVGFDALHFFFQVAFVARRCPVAEAASLARRQAQATLDALGVPAGARDLVTALHLAELFVRHEEARSSAGSIDDRFYPAVGAALEHALAPGAASAACHGGRERAA